MKREPVTPKRQDDKWLERLMPSTLGLGAEAGGPELSPACLDAETLAALTDGTLDTRAMAEAERHASGCARCMTLLAAMARTSPEPPPRESWLRSRMFRWVVPLTAAATAVAIWVAVPDQRDGRVDTVATPQPPAAPAAPGIPEPPRSLTEPEAAPPAAQLRAQSPSAAGRGITRADALRETVDTAEELRATVEGVLPQESVSPSDPSARWRIVEATVVERSVDGGKSWVRAMAPPGVGASGAAALTILSITAVDAKSATVTTSGGTTYSTTDAGTTWTRVQEKPAAPF